MIYILCTFQLMAKQKKKKKKKKKNYHQRKI